MISQCALEISGTWDSLQVPLLPVILTTLTHLNLIPLGMKIIVGKLHPMESLRKTELISNIPDVMILTKSMNGMPLESVKVSIGIALQ